jgi:hypothetical protein
MRSLVIQMDGFTKDARGTQTEPHLHLPSHYRRLHQKSHQVQLTPRPLPLQVPLTHPHLLVIDLGLLTLVQRIT